MVLKPPSQAAKSKLLSKLQAAGLSVENFSTRFVHVADVSSELDSAEIDKLESLLTYGPKEDETSSSGQTLIVCPRPGTISPWSSKATDIAHNCGLTKIKRIERAIEYTFSGKELNIDKLAAHIHDRMMESVLNNNDQLSSLFLEGELKNPFHCWDHRKR